MEFLINNLLLFVFTTVGLTLWCSYLIYRFLASNLNLETAGEPNGGLFLTSIALTGVSMLVTVASIILNLG